MAVKYPRIAKESKTIAVMISLYCHDLHGSYEPCPECRELLDYAIQRLEKCPFQEGKTTCAKCTVHCFKPAMREQVRAVMRYSGPRMIYRHPILAIFHIVGGLRKEPVSQLSKGKNEASGKHSEAQPSRLNRTSDKEN